MKKVLIVDDDPDMRSLYQLVLSNAGLEVIEARSGTEALSIVQSEMPALVLLDIMMPEMDGYEVCRQLRANPRSAKVPILLFSARATNTGHRNGLLAGADDFIDKAVGPRALVDRVHSLLSASLVGRDAVPATTTSH